MARRTDAEVMAELKSDSPLNKARAKFSNWCGRIEQEGMQRKPAGPVEIRRLEFEAVEAIRDALAPTWQETHSDGFIRRIDRLEAELAEARAQIKEQAKDAYFIQQRLTEERDEARARIAAKDAALQDILQPFDELIVHAGNMVRWADIENAIDEAHRRFAAPAQEEQ